MVAVLLWMVASATVRMLYLTWDTHMAAGQRGNFPSIPGSTLVHGSVWPIGLTPPCLCAIHRPCMPWPQHNVLLSITPAWHMLDSSNSWQYPLQILLPLPQGSDGQAEELSVPSPCRASPSSGCCRRMLGPSDTTLQGGVSRTGSVQPDGGKGPGWECGMLWAPAPLSLGDCKIPMYITWLHGCVGDWCSRVQ